MKEYIKVRGAKENNLKNIDVDIPRNKLVVFTGLSGSGKSSLVFDTIFAEGRRRYVESLSSYARQFLGQAQKPDVESIEGLSPAISIDQKTTSHNPRSTVGTVTEIYDYLRLLYARIGIPHCTKCGREITPQTVDQIADQILANGSGKLQILAPIVRGRKGEYTKQLESLKRSGFLRVRIDGIDYLLEEEIKLEKNNKHSISVIVDRLVVKNNINRRLTDSLETAIKLSEGLVIADIDGVETLYSTKFACPECNISLEELSPRVFSFNSPYGACPHCAGLGFKEELDIDLLIKHKDWTLNQGALGFFGFNLDNKISGMQFKALSKFYEFSLDVPYKDLSEDIKKILLFGNRGEKIEMNYETKSFNGVYMNDFEGVVNALTRRYHDSGSDYSKKELAKYMRLIPCGTCKGNRLKPEVLAVTVGDNNIAQLSSMSIIKLQTFIYEIELNPTHTLIAAQIVKEINARLQFLVNVGLDYLTLSRTANTLSGGEAQRIRLATQIGSGLTGVLYVLDEPSIGLHQRDNNRLLQTLMHLRDLGNTLLVVEHDEETIGRADYIVDIGVGAGIHGGRLVVCGTPKEVMDCENSITGQYLSGKLSIPIPENRRTLTDKYLTIRGAKNNNLKNINVDIPLGVFTSITGVSGSGKSSLINGIIYPYLANILNGANLAVGAVDNIQGLEYLDKVINIDQSPIGKTPRSNPATYTGVFSAIRDLFAMTPEAKARGYKAGRFSFNVAGGRCENCQGGGIIKIEMHFLPDIYVPCEVCKGNRYNRETLEVRYKGKNISEVLDMTVEKAVVFFENIPAIYRKIKCLFDVGLSYIKLGQASTTLSGGEAQRVKLATELSKRSTGKTMYILDEPTTGLHTDDVLKLIVILDKLVDNGNTVVVIEHNLEVIKVSDYIIDLGLNGGDKGGEIIVQGTPEVIAQHPISYTGEYLKKVLKK